MPHLRPQSSGDSFGQHQHDGEGSSPLFGSKNEANRPLTGGVTRGFTSARVMDVTGTGMSSQEMSNVAGGGTCESGTARCWLEH